MTFVPGQMVEAVASFGWRITEDKHYEVLEIIPRLVTPTFTWPEYVVFIDDHGDKCSAHTHRFKST